VLNENGNSHISQKSPLDIEIGQRSRTTTPQEELGLWLLRLHKQYPDLELHEVHDALLLGEFSSAHQRRI
jgi:hypothetical protein